MLIPLIANSRRSLNGDYFLFYCVLLLLLTILALQQVMNFDNSTRVGKE